MKTNLVLLAFAFLATAFGVAAQAPDGAALFQQHCATCHAGAAAAASRAPTRAVLAEKTQQEILQTLESGAMVIYGNQMNETERRAVAAFLSSKIATDVSRANLCAPAPPITPAGLADPHNWNGWGVDVVNSRYQPHTSLDPENVAHLNLKWAFGIPNASSALGQPTIVSGRLFIGSGDGTVYALDASTGCTIWAFKADTTVRDAITVAAGDDGRAFAYFGDSEANLYALDASDGKLAWKTKVDPHPTARITGAPQLYDGRLYVPLTGNEELTGGDPAYPCCTFRGEHHRRRRAHRQADLEGVRHRQNARPIRARHEPREIQSGGRRDVERADHRREARQRSTPARATPTSIPPMKAPTRSSLSISPAESASGCSRKLPATFSISAASSRSR